MRVRAGIVVEANASFAAGESERCGQQSAGFTLVETLTAILVIGLIAALALPYAHRPSPSARLQAQATKVVSVLRATRASAIRSNTEQSVMIDTSRFTVRSPTAQAAQLDPELTIHVVFADLERRSVSQAGMRFFPNGQSTGGKLRLNLGHLTTTVGINWATGYAAIEN
jgi:general secretion pathway protein H